MAASVSGLASKPNLRRDLSRGKPAAFEAPLGPAAGPVVAFGQVGLGEEAEVRRLLAAGGFGEFGELGPEGGQPRHPVCLVERGRGGLLGGSSPAGHGHAVLLQGAGWSRWSRRSWSWWVTEGRGRLSGGMRARPVAGRCWSSPPRPGPGRGTRRAHGQRHGDAADDPGPGRGRRRPGESHAGPPAGVDNRPPAKRNGTDQHGVGPDHRHPESIESAVLTTFSQHRCRPVSSSGP